MRINPQLKIWLGIFFVFVLSGFGFFYGLKELNTNEETTRLFVAVFVMILLVGLNIFQAVTTHTRARHLAEYMNQDLSSSRELFMELFTNSPVPYLLINRKGKITFSNTVALRLFGVQKGELEGQNVFKLIEGDDEKHTSFISSRLRAGDFVNNEELRIKRSDNSLRWVILSAFPYAGKTKGLVTLVDITKQKEIDKAKTEFVSLASHQLRTPLTALRWNIELLESKKVGELSTSQRSYVKKIERNVEKMNAIVDDFLQVSHLELGTFATKLSDVSLAPFLDDVFEGFVEQVKAKNISFEKNYATEDIIINTDKHLLHTIISNLVSNAVKYTPENGLVRMKYTTDAKFITIVIQDSGFGIPKGEQEKLFTKFFRASNVHTKVMEGTGLGLYIVAKAVDFLKGTINVTSEENKGATFTVVLPR